MMYSPNTIAADPALWAKLTRAFADCNVKAHDEDFTKPDGSPGTAYSIESVYAALKSTTTDIHHFVLQFLEEGAIDLVCLMTPLSMDRCDTIRATNGVSCTSTCMSA